MFPLEDKFPESIVMSSQFKTGVTSTFTLYVFPGSTLTAIIFPAVEPGKSRFAAKSIFVVLVITVSFVLVVRKLTSWFDFPASRIWSVVPVNPKKFDSTSLSVKSFPLGNVFVYFTLIPQPNQCN